MACKLSKICCYTRKDDLEIHDSRDDLKFPDDQKTITVVTLNVFCLLSWCYSHRRARKLVELLRCFDVIFLEEAFDKCAVDVFVEGLNDNHFVVKNIGSDKCCVGVNSGLLLASKFPIEEIEFYSHKLVADDNCSNKGVYKATLRIPHLGSVDFIAGHLQSSLDMLECPYFWKCCGIEEPQASACRRAALLTIQGLIRETPKNRQVFVLGDLNVKGNLGKEKNQQNKLNSGVKRRTKDNCDKNSTENKTHSLIQEFQEYEDMKSTLELVDIFREKNPYADGFTWGSQQRLDFIFGRSNFLDSIQNIEVFEVGNLSDHDGVMMEIVLKPTEENSEHVFL